MKTQSQLATTYFRDESARLNAQVKDACEELDPVFSKLLLTHNSHIIAAFGWIVSHENMPDSASMRGMSNTVFKAAGSHDVLLAYAEIAKAKIPQPILYKFQVLKSAFEALLEEDRQANGIAARQNAAVQAAFTLVATFAPDVATVDFDEDCRWTFKDAQGTPVIFPKSDVVMDVSTLEAAADVVNTPSTFVREL
jgi:hypothetical protein